MPAEPGTRAEGPPSLSEATVRICVLRRWFVKKYRKIKEGRKEDEGRKMKEGR